MVLFIGATTPLAIKLGGDAFTPIAGLTLRIVLALTVGIVFFAFLGVRLRVRKHWLIYLAASLGIFPNLVLVYTAVQYISSGLVALLFGMQPFFTALLMKPFLGVSGLQPRKIFAIFLAFGGLGLIVLEGDSVQVNNVIGVLLMLGSSFLFAVSALWVKRLNQSLTVPPFEQTLGGMLFSLPGLFLSWWLIFGIEPITLTPIALGSLLYLALIVSLLGFAAYYSILNKMAIETVALIPLVTPVMALVLGVVFLDETITVSAISGAVLLLIALAIHQKL